MSTPAQPVTPRIGYQAPGPFGLNTTNVDPPMPLYIRKDEILQLKVWNSLSGVQVTISWKMLMSDGQVIDSSYTKAPTSARAANTYTFPMEEGYLLSVFVSATTGAPARGQTFVQVQTGRGNANGMQTATALLIQDYVTATLGAAWPNGQIRTSLEGPGYVNQISVANPAAGADWLQAVPTNARWRVVGVVMSLTTSSAVANRAPALYFAAVLSVAGAGQPSVVQPASQTTTYYCAPATTPAELTVTVAVINIPSFVPLIAAGYLGTLTANIQAADQWAGIKVIVEEWLDI